MASKARTPVAAGQAAQASAAVSLRLLHAPCLVIDGQAEHALPPNDAALLAMLALDGPSPRAKVAAMLWPEVDSEHAHNNLRQRLFRLRRVAGRDVVVQGATLALAPGIGHDLIDPQSALDADAAARPGELLGAQGYDDSIELAQWVASAREQWRAARRDVLAAIAAKHEKADRIAAALPYAERLVREEPLAEHAARQLMRLHYRRGDRSAALAAYERLRHALDEQLGETTAPETQQLNALIEASLQLPVAAPPPTPVAVLRPPRLIGREREWAQMEAAWGQGGCVLICGEPGIGKSRLLQDFADAKRVAARACARPGDAGVPYALLARIVRSLMAAGAATWQPQGWAREELARIVPELGGSPMGALVPVRLRQAAEQALATAGCDALAVDDLQFGDAATLELLPALVAAEPSPRWLLAVRAGEVPAAIGEWLASPQALAVQRVSVGPFDVSSVEHLLASLQLYGFDAAAMAPALHRHTGGNPLFILETLRTLLLGDAAAVTAATILPVPAKLEALVLRRFEALSPPAQRLARIAALAGQDFSAALAARVLQVHVLDLTSAWTELDAAQVMREGVFVHDLIAEALSRSIPAAIASVLHGSIATFLRQHGGEPARMAWHWLAAGEPAAAGADYVEAAARARRSGRRDLELELLDRAHRCLLDGGQAAAAFACARRAVRAAKYVGAITDALARADALVAGASADLERAAALEVRAGIHIDMLASPQALADAELALALLAGSVPGELAALVAQRYAMALSQSGRQADALAVIESALDRVDSIEDADSRVEFLNEYGTLLDRANRRREALRALQRAQGMALEHGCLAAAADALNSLAISSFYLGRVRDAAHYAEQARALGPRVGAEEGSTLIDEMSIAAAYLDAGRFSEALDQ